MRIDCSFPTAPLIEPGLGAGRLLGRRKEEEGQVIGVLEMSPLFLELRFTLDVDKRRNRLRKFTLGIVLSYIPPRLDEDRPAGAETPQRVVEPRAGADELGRCR